MLTLGPFRPDIADTAPGILADLLNASLKRDPQGVAYGPLDGFILADETNYFVDPIRGSLTCVTAAGAYILFFMTDTRIYKITDSGVSGASIVGSGYNLPSGDRWSGTQFGSKAIFTNTFDGMLEYDIELGGSVTAITDAPAARVVRTVFDVLFALDCDGENKLMRNSDFDYTNWTTGVSGYQPMPDGEELVGIEEVADGTALVFQRSAIRALYRIADQSLYQMRKMAVNQGAINPWCIVPNNGFVYYNDVNGFHRASTGGIERIGEGKIDHWWLNDLSADGQSRVQAAYDPNREVIRTLYKRGVDNSDDYFSGIVDFDIATSEFVPVSDGSLGAIFTTATPGYTMEDLDIFGDMDDLNDDMSLDDHFYFGGIAEMSGFRFVPGVAPNPDGYFFGHFTGANLAFLAETTTLSDNQSSRVNWCRPVTDADTVEVQVGRSDRLQDALTWNTAAGIQPSGRVALESPTRGKNHRFRVTIDAGDTWTFIRGLDDIDPKTGGPK